MKSNLTSNKAKQVKIKLPLYLLYSACSGREVLIEVQTLTSSVMAMACLDPVIHHTLTLGTSEYSGNRARLCQGTAGSSGNVPEAPPVL